MKTKTRKTLKILLFISAFTLLAALCFLNTYAFAAYSAEPKNAQIVRALQEQAESTESTDTQPTEPEKEPDTQPTEPEIEHDTEPTETPEDSAKYQELLDKINSITAKLKDSQVYIYAISGLTAIIVGIATVLARTFGKLKAFKAGFKVSADEANELKSILQNFDKESILRAVNEVVGKEVAEAISKVMQSSEVKQTELAKIISENAIVKEQLDKVIEALKLAWSQRVDGIDAVLAKTPSTTAYNKMALENKMLKEQIVATNKEQGETVVMSIENKAETELKGAAATSAVTAENAVKGA